MPGKIEAHRLTKQQQAAFDAELWGTMCALKDAGSVVEFLQDFLTSSEQIMLARRIQIAKKLLSGASYDAIRRELGVGIATVQRVDRWLRKTYRWYRRDFPQLYSQRLQKRFIRKRFPEPGTFRHLRRKYPLHFLLFNLLSGDRR